MLDFRRWMLGFRRWDGKKVAFLFDTVRKKDETLYGIMMHVSSIKYQVC